MNTPYKAGESPTLSGGFVDSSHPAATASGNRPASSPSSGPQSSTGNRPNNSSGSGSGKGAEKSPASVQDVKTQATEAAQKAKNQAMHAAAEVRDAATQAAENAKQKSIQLVEQQRTKAVQHLSGFEGAIHSAGQKLRDEENDNLADYADIAAEKLGQFRSYLENRDLERMLHDVENFARRRPELVFGTMAVAGLALARFLKASSRSRRVENVGGSPASGNYNAGSTASGGYASRRQSGSYGSQASVPSPTPHYRPMDTYGSASLQGNTDRSFPSDSPNRSDV